MSRKKSYAGTGRWGTRAVNMHVDSSTIYIDVNKAESNVVNQVRTRRTPEQAREAVLTVAAARLREFGLKGLNVKDVAAAAGMSHATLLHHFGSADQMQQALIVQLTRRLVADLLEALRDVQTSDPRGICQQLFDVMARDGHVRLVAWVAVTGQEMSDEMINAPLFAELVELLRERLCLDSLDEARQTVLLVASAAIGFELVRDALPALIGLDADGTAAFPSWVASRLPGTTDC